LSTVSMKITESPKIAVPTIGVAGMRRISSVALESAADRVGRGFTVSDSPATPLNRSYARAKLRKGLKPIRDLRFSGRTMSSFKLRSAGNKQATIGFDDPIAAQRAADNDAISPMIGLSPTDQRRVGAAAADELARAIREAS